MTVTTFKKPKGYPMPLTGSGDCFHFEVLKISSEDDQGQATVTIDIDIYEGIDLVVEAVKLYELQMREPRMMVEFLAVIYQMLALMNSEQIKEYVKLTFPPETAPMD